MSTSIPGHPQHLSSAGSRSDAKNIYSYINIYGAKRGLKPPKQGGSHRTTEDVASPLSAFTPSAAVDDLEQSILAPLGLLQLLFQLPDLFLSLRSRLLGPAATTSSSSVIASRRAGGGEGAKISSSDANKRLARSRSTSWTPVGSVKGWSEKLGCGACTQVRLWHARDAVQQAGEGAEPPSKGLSRTCWAWPLGSVDFSSASSPSLVLAHLPPLASRMLR